MEETYNKAIVQIEKLENIIQNCKGEEKNEIVFSDSKTNEQKRKRCFCTVCLSQQTKSTNKSETINNFLQKKTDKIKCTKEGKKNLNQRKNKVYYLSKSKDEK